MKSECPHKDLFIDYLLNNLDLQKKQRLETHMSDCKTCLDLFVKIHKEQIVSIKELSNSEHDERNALKQFRNKLYKTYFFKDQNETTRKHERFSTDYLLNETVDNYIQTQIETIIPYPYVRRIKDIQLNLYIVRVNKKRLNLNIYVPKEDNSLINTYVKLIRDGKYPYIEQLKDGMASFEEINYGSNRLFIEQNGKPVCGICFELTKDGLIGL